MVQVKLVTVSHYIMPFCPTVSLVLDGVTLGPFFSKPLLPKIEFPDHLFLTVSCHSQIICILKFPGYTNPKLPQNRLRNNRK